MKTIKHSFFAFAVLLAVLTSCNKTEKASSDQITSADAADMVSTAVADNSSGLTTTIDDIISQTAVSTESSQSSQLKSALADYTKDTTITRSNPAGSLITYAYTFHYSYDLAVNNLGIPVSMTTGYDYTGEFDAPRLQSSNSGSGSISVTGLEIASTQYTFAGSYKRDGSFQSKVRNKYSSNSSVDFSFTDLKIDKSTYKILSGTASVSITGNNSKNGAFSVTGNLVFNGDQTATLTVNGVVYVINLVTGDVTEG